MATVSLKVGGKNYEIDCPEGQEARIRQLSEAVDRRIRPLRQSFSHATDSMVLVVLALTLQDEIERLQKGETSESVPVVEDHSPLDDFVQQAVEPAIAQIEALAKRLKML